MTRSEILQIAKPILFNTEEVLATLDGRKTATRKIVNFPKYRNPRWTGYIVDGTVLYGSNNIPAAKSPYKPGDYLYVRETWNGLPASGIFPAEFWYKADEKMLNPDEKWRPSIHMPKEAARIFLRVTDVRVERLQEIDENGILAEGIDNGRSNPAMGKRWENMQRMKFENLWDSTIPPKDRDKYGWAANPWVFVIEFERVKVGG